jgi:hypothetical protein
MAFGAAGGAPPAEINSFTITFNYESSGDVTWSGSAVLSWDTSDADTVSINQGVGSVAGTGSTTVSIPLSGSSVSPSNYNITYTLTATGLNGVSVTSSITITCAARCTGRVVWGRCYGSDVPYCTQ